MTDSPPRNAADKARRLLMRIGEALYGERWKQHLSITLNVDDRALRRWIATGQIPPGVWLELVALLTEQRRRIDDLIAEASRAA